jgi:Aminotransferase class I and II
MSNSLRIANHHAIFNNVGITPVDYPYYNPATIGLDYNGFLGVLHNAVPRSVFLLHACAHNPTGVDPTEKQWTAIANVMLEKGHYAFFDCAYQGFASGDLDRDAFAVRIPPFSHATGCMWGFTYICSSASLVFIGSVFCRTQSAFIDLPGTSFLLAVGVLLTFAFRVFRRTLDYMESVSVLCMWLVRQRKRERMSTVSSPCSSAAKSVIHPRTVLVWYVRISGYLIFR